MSSPDQNRAVRWRQIRARADEALATIADPQVRRTATDLWRTAPRRALLPHLVNYRLDQKRVLDVGCSFGQALAFFGQDSVGFDYEVEGVEFARDRLGLDAHIASVFGHELYDIAPRRGFEAVWFCHVLEHLNAPHVALMRLRQTLQDGGLLFLSVPVIPAWWVGAVWRGLFCARNRFRYWSPLTYESSDHINGFTPATVRFMAERAGFRVERTVPTWPAQPGLQKLIGPLLVPLFDVITVVARVDHSWNYHPKAAREVDEEQGWRYRSTVGGSLTIDTGEEAAQ